MITRTASFNTILLLLATLVIGCQNPEVRKQKKERSTMRLHLQSGSITAPRAGAVPIMRANPIYLNVEGSSFLDEGSIVEARVIEAIGGFAIQLQFDRHGTFMLDTVTTANRGKRIAIRSQFDEDRWLGAPRINERISNGVLIFTPDASREEAERIVRGLNNLVAEMKRKGRSQLW